MSTITKTEAGLSISIRIGIGLVIIVAWGFIINNFIYDFWQHVRFSSKQFTTANTLVVAEAEQSNPELTIEIRGSKWRWKYKYIKATDSTSNMSFISSMRKSQRDNVLRNRAEKITVNKPYQVDQPLVLPTNKKIRLIFDSFDVLHSWRVDGLGLNVYTRPKQTDVLWLKIKPGKEGLYYGDCNIACGRFHDFMPIVVKAVTQTQFSNWYSTESKKQLAIIASHHSSAYRDLTSKPSLMKFGKIVYNRNCAGCHQQSGLGLGRTFPALKGMRLSEHEVLKSILKGQGVMPSFEKFSDAKIAAVATYIRNSWGNQGSIVTPSMVKKSR